MSLAAATEQRTFQGRAAAPGLAAGPLVVLADTEEVRREAGSAETEAAALREALESAVSELSLLVAETEGEGGDILAFQLALAEDEVLSDPAFAAIAAGRDAVTAWCDAVATVAADYAAAEEEYFRARAADLDDLSARVVRLLAGGAGDQDLPAGAILLARDLPPSRFLAARWEGGGVALIEGSPTSHVAILARARGVPMVVGLGAAAAALAEEDGPPALLDGDSGLLTVRPEAQTVAAFHGREAAAAEEAMQDRAVRNGPAVTAEGEAVSVLINVGDPAELDAVDPAWTDGIGLVRTEFLFQGRGGRLPDEAEQLAVYRRILAWAAPRPVTIRTLDAGGDKPIPGYTPTGESNPFLGLRGVRLSLAHPEVFRVQLRALLRAATAGNLQVMVPMVSLPQEMEAVRALLDEAADSLMAEGQAWARPALGMMVEVPAAALTIADFDADFLSIGSNDLVQYLMAAGRDVAGVAALADPATPAFERTLRLIVEAARAKGVPLSLCGDAGGEPRLLPLLLGAGLRSVSVAPPLIGRVKRAIAGWSGTRGR